MVDISNMFNSTGEIGNWITASTTNLTGDNGLTFLILIGGLLLIGALLKMPQLLVLIAIFPLIIIISTVESTFMTILGIAILIAGITIAGASMIK